MDETHILEMCLAWMKTKQNIFLSVKDDGDCIMTWTRFAASGPGWLVISDTSYTNKLTVETKQHLVEFTST